MKFHRVIVTTKIVAQSIENLIYIIERIQIRSSTTQRMGSISIGKTDMCGKLWDFSSNPPQKESPLRSSANENGIDSFVVQLFGITKSQQLLSRRFKQNSIFTILRKKCCNICHPTI